VPHDKFTFEGLTAIEDRLRRRASDIAYIMVWDRTDRKAEEPLGRLELSEDDTRPYLDGGDLADAFRDAKAPDAEDDDASDDDASDEHPDGEDDLPPEPDGDPTPEDLARAACRWLRDLAIRNTVGEHYRRIRIRAYGAKGIRVVDTGSFVCRNHDVDLDIPLPEPGTPLGLAPEEANLRIPTPSFDEAANVGAARSIKALGDYYAQWGQIVLGSVGQLQGVNNAMLGRLHKQLDESRGQVDDLVAAVLNYRFEASQADASRKSDERQDDTRHALAREALQQLGEAARAFLVAKGVPPELTDVLGAIGGSPELMHTLNDPDVRTLMKDPGNLAALAAMLKNAAAVSKAAQNPANNPPNPGAQAA
jgi:hypothetical protein